jgi:hypothetical protein
LGGAIQKEVLARDIETRDIKGWTHVHPDVKWFIQQEDTKTKAYNNYAKRVNENMGAGLKYQKNRYTGKIPF